MDDRLSLRCEVPLAPGRLSLPAAIIVLLLLATLPASATEYGILSGMVIAPLVAFRSRLVACFDASRYYGPGIS